jgi:hypothetical protein
MFPFAAFCQSEQRAAGTPLKFELLSIRPLEPSEEARKKGDMIYPDLVVRYRIYNTGTMPVYLYSNFPYSVSFAGNVVKKTGNGITWLVGSSHVEYSKSPGLRKMNSGGWLSLFEGSAIEWEELEISRPEPEMHARTCFIRYDEGGPIAELFSEFYEVPAAAVTTTVGSPIK